MAMTSGSHESKSGASFRSGAEDVGDNITALRNDIANLADSVKRLASEQLGASVGEVQDRAMEKIDDVETAIRRNPAQSALIAAGVGLLVGLLLVR